MCFTSNQTKIITDAHNLNNSKWNESPGWLLFINNWGKGAGVVYENSPRPNSSEDTVLLSSWAPMNPMQRMAVPGAFVCVVLPFVCSVHVPHQPTGCLTYSRPCTLNILHTHKLNNLCECSFHAAYRTRHFGLHSCSSIAERGRMPEQSMRLDPPFASAQREGKTI